eukprot:4122304-Prymnesium_polylepis.1
MCKQWAPPPPPPPWSVAARRPNRLHAVAGACESAATAITDHRKPSTLRSGKLICLHGKSRPAFNDAACMHRHTAHG